MANLRIQTNRLKKGMIIKADVYTHSGVVIVPAETIVTKEVFELLTKHLVDEVLVEYNLKKKETSLSYRGKSLPEEKKKRVEEFTQEFYGAEESLSRNLKDIVEQDEDVDIQGLLNTVQAVVNKADNDMDLCTMLLGMKNYSESLYAHSIHVALYGKLLAGWVDLEKEEREYVVLAGLLHDIGHLKYSEKEQKRLLLHDELRKCCNEKHPMHGYKLLKDKTLDYRVKQAVLTHHERMDESGFPMGISYENINGIARILAIADTYVTLTTEESGYPAVSPFEALKYLQMQELGKFDSRYLLVFMEHLAQSFIQQKVRLNNDKVGTVVMLNKLDLLRPLVQVEDYFVDLSVHKDLLIKEVLM